MIIKYNSKWGLKPSVFVPCDRGMEISGKSKKADAFQ